MDGATAVDRDDLRDPLPPDLARVGLLGRFPPATEDAYRAWAVDEALPFVRLVGWLSIVVWVIAPFVVGTLLSADPPAKTFLVCWGHVVMLVAALLAARTRPRMWLAVAPVLVVGLDLLLLVDWMDIPSEPMLMISTTSFCLFLGPVMHFPVRTMAAFLVVLLPATLVYSLTTASREGTWNSGLNIQLWLLGASSVFALAMTLLLENGSRSRYAGEQVLARQQVLLRSSRALIRRYAPPAVAERLEHGDITVGSAQRRRVTIFFADVVGFTSLADRLDPEALAEVMNDYLGSVAEIVERRGGTLNEFAGDGVMALFGAPDDLEPREQVSAALAAARELQRSLPSWSRRWYPLGIDQDLKARIGVNTGVVSVGSFGSAVRATYTGIGLQTNIAARIQAQCPPGSVLLSATSFHLVSEQEGFTLRGEVDVKGVHFPIAVYEPAAR